jgi:ribosomal-protein-alanine N-acetyltransferase
VADELPTLAPDLATSLLQTLSTRAGRQLDRLDHWPLEQWAGAPGLQFTGSDESGWAGILVVPVNTGGPAAWQARPGGPGWIRWIGVDDRAPLGPRLRALLRAGFQAACAGGLSGLWLLCDSGGWLDPYLRDEGFRGIDEVITLERKTRPARTSAPSARAHGLSPAAGPLRFRFALAEDADAVAAVDGPAFSDPWRYAPATLARELSMASVGRVALDGARIVGYATAVVRDTGGHINRIAVDPGEQGRGIGRALLSDMLAELELRGAMRTTLNTQRSNPISQRLYRSMGFRPLGPPLRVYHRPLG